MPSIRLHPTLGLNPKLCVCFYCGKETGELALPGAKYMHRPGMGEFDQYIVASREPCEWCKGNMKLGIILVEASEREIGPCEYGPVPTGAYVVLKVEAWERMPINEPLKTQVLKTRLGMIEPEAWTQLGLREACKVGAEHDTTN